MNKIKITVKLFATLRENRGKILNLDFEENVTPQKIIEYLQIDNKDVAILLVNGRDGSLNQNLQENDIISIFPPVGGG
jgi:molybdopterin converting factor small subunit